MINIEEAKNFFCRASVERFEERIETRNVFGNHLAGVCIFEEDDWKYVFFRSRDGAIAIGLVVLWLDGNPVWKMELGGPYTRECGKFLTTAILANLKNNDFRGGRGPAQFTDPKFPGYEYRNEVYCLPENNFSEFSGREEVLLDGQSQGWHYLEGGLWKINGKEVETWKS